MVSTTVEERNEEKVEKARRLMSWNLVKIDLASQWIDEKEMHQSRTILRGGVYGCELGENIGTEQGKCRPVLVVSNAIINGTAGNVTVVPLTRTLRVKRNKQGHEIPKFRTHFFLRKEQFPFLVKDSAVLGDQVKTVNKVRIKDYWGSIDEATLQRIIAKIKWIMD